MHLTGSGMIGLDAKLQLAGMKERLSVEFNIDINEILERDPSPDLKEEELREKVKGIYGGGTFANVSKFPYSNYSFVLQNDSYMENLRKTEKWQTMISGISMKKYKKNKL